jgi:DNA-binding MarR family transcriptional regulator
VAAHVPISTALRCIAQMEKEGWITRERDESDRRRSFVILTDQAVTRIERLIGSHTPAMRSGSAN